MDKISWRNVVSGGLLAGFVANLLQFTANNLYLRAEWIAVGAPWNRGTNPTFSHVALAVMTFAGGILAVFMYAMMRLWLRPGPRTAAIAGLTFWVSAWLYDVLIWTLSGGLPTVPMKLWATHLGTYLVVAIVQTEVGAWIYKPSNSTPSGAGFTAQSTGVTA